MSAPITLIGRVGTEPELRPTSTPVVTFRVVSSARKNVGGEWTDVDTSWWSVVSFGYTAEGVLEGLHKGDLVVVIGRIKETTWEKDGVKNRSVEVVADHVAKELRIISGQARKETAALGAGDPWASNQAAF